MNIKKIMPLFAIAIAVMLAVGTSGFINKADKSLAMHTFEYTAPSGSFAQADVEDPANWQYTTLATRCNDDDVKACRIFVTDDDVVSSGSGYDLNPGFQINASSGSISYVTSTDAGSSSTFISNRSGL